MGNHQFHPSIIREYDIRGVIDKTLGELDAFALGQAFGTMVARAGGKTIAVGYDGREHSPRLEFALIKGINSTGMNTTSIGLGPTPMLYFATYHLKLDAGIMITGSHNPADQNGFKMMLGKHLPSGGSIYGARIKEIAQMAYRADFIVGAGQNHKHDIQDDFVARLAMDYQGIRDLKVAWDCGNGASGEIIRRLIQKIPGKHILLFDEIDGTFPNHHPDPTRESNLRDLQNTVRQEKCDLGIAFDGDADRIGAVDENGVMLAGDQLLAIFASEVLKTHPSSPIIADVKASQELFALITRLGGVAVMSKTGHSLIKAKMAETHAPLAGEMSGHLFFADKYYGYDDGIYAGVRLLCLLSQSPQALSELRKILPATCATPEIRFEVEEVRKFAVIEEIKKTLAQQKIAFNDLDGIRMMGDDGWFLLRASNTESCLVARAESRTEAGLARLIQSLKTLLGDAGITLPKL